MSRSYHDVCFSAYTALFYAGGRLSPERHAAGFIDHGLDADCTLYVGRFSLELMDVFFFFKRFGKTADESCENGKTCPVYEVLEKRCFRAFNF